MLKMIGCAAAALLLTACGGAGSTGYIAQDDLVLTLDKAELTIGDVLAGGNQNVPQTATFEALPAANRCRVVRPRGPALVVNVSAYEGEEVSRDRLWWTTPGTDYYEQIEQSEIIVTETERPVFLILGSYESILWKIHAAPGVQIDGVVAASLEPSLITGDVTPDRIGFVSRKLDGQKDCAIYPSTSSPEKAKVWKRFMSDYLRKPAKQMSAYRVNGALIGPAPSEPVAATALFDTPVYMPETGRQPVIKTFKEVRDIYRNSRGS